MTIDLFCFVSTDGGQAAVMHPALEFAYAVLFSCHAPFMDF